MSAEVFSYLSKAASNEQLSSRVSQLHISRLGFFSNLPAPSSRSSVSDLRVLRRCRRR